MSLFLRSEGFCCLNFFCLCLLLRARFASHSHTHQSRLTNHQNCLQTPYVRVFCSVCRTVLTTIITFASHSPAGPLYRSNVLESQSHQRLLASQLLLCTGLCQHHQQQQQAADRTQGPLCPANAAAAPVTHAAGLGAPWAAAGVLLAGGASSSTFLSSGAAAAQWRSSRGGPPR